MRFQSVHLRLKVRVHSRPIAVLLFCALCARPHRYAKRCGRGLFAAIPSLPVFEFLLWNFLPSLVWCSPMVTSDLIARANPWLKDIVSYIPGKPIDDVARELGLPPEKIVKLASNENPIGPSPKAVAAMTEALTKAHFYPDGGGYHLRKAIAEKFGLDLSNVALGNGSNEIIEFMGHAFLTPGDSIVVADHAFVIYKLMAHLFGASAIEVPDPGLTADVDAMIEAITPRTKLIYIANPNNPTGTMVGAAELDRLAKNVPSNVGIVFDEAYYEYVPSSANFVLVKVGNGQQIFEKLLRRGTIVRATGEYKLPEWVRVSVGTMEQNRRFFDDLDAVMAE